jgi:hypothetical protein
MTVTDLTTSHRNLDLEGIVTLLREQQTHKHDVVVPANMLRSGRGRIIAPDAWDTLTADGVTRTDLVLEPSLGFDSDFAGRQDIPVRYLRKLRSSSAEERAALDASAWAASPWTDLLDRTFNTHLQADTRQVLVRSFVNDEGEGVGRALLSDRFNIIDNLDVLMSALDGLREGGIPIVIDGCDISERRMTIRVVAPEVTALAPELLAGYRTPFENRGRPGYGHGQEGLRGEHGDLPIVFGGFEISNSETGGAQFAITPRLVVKVCNNGMLITRDAAKQVHLGGRMDAGIIRISDDTQQKNLALVRATTRDVAMTFCDADYVTAAVAKLTAAAGKVIADPAATITRVSKECGFTEAEQADILSCFIKGGVTTSGGIMHAVTAAAQMAADPDRAAALEQSGVKAMTLV